MEGGVDSGGGTEANLGQMTRADLVQWTRPQRVIIRRGDLAKERVMALAERTWDTIESGTLDGLKKGHNLKKGKPKKVSSLSRRRYHSRRMPLDRT
jgi:hypothetical protein